MNIIVAIPLFTFLAYLTWVGIGIGVCLWKDIPAPDKMRDAFVVASKWPMYLFH